MKRVLLERINRGCDIILIIDEAKNPSFAVLAQIRRQPKPETDKQKLRQVVLIGQPELNEIPPPRGELRQRSCVHSEFHPVSLIDLEHDGEHQLTLAGGTGRPPFTRWALHSLHDASAGFPASSIISATRPRSRPPSGSRTRSPPGTRAASSGNSKPPPNDPFHNATHLRPASAQERFAFGQSPPSPFIPE